MIERKFGIPKAGKSLEVVAECRLRLGLLLLMLVMLVKMKKI